MKILFFLTLVMADALPRVRHEALKRKPLSLSARNLCEICSCTNVDVFCSALHDPSLLQHYEGTNVESLSIYDSNLSTLREEHFVKFRNIKDLSLISNDLVINSTELGLLQDLTTLNLESNSLKTFADGMFDGNTNLVKLSMSKNKISHIANGTFPDLRRVTTLRLDHNHIKGMDLQALRGLPALEELDLSYNLLDHVNAAWFDPLPRLQTLRLEHNKVATFGPSLVKLAVRRALAVSLAGNPVRCECGPVRDAWQSAHAARLTLDVTCAHGQPWGQALATLECGSAAEAKAAAAAAAAAEVEAEAEARTAPEPGHAPILAASVVYVIWVIVALCTLLSIAMIIVVLSVWRKPSVCENEITYCDVEPHYETLD